MGRRLACSCAAPVGRIGEEGASEGAACTGAPSRPDQGIYGCNLFCQFEQVGELGLTLKAFFGGFAAEWPDALLHLQQTSSCTVWLTLSNLMAHRGGQACTRLSHKHAKPTGLRAWAG